MIAIEQALPKKYVLACIMAFFALGTSSLAQAPNNETTMANIHRHLSSTMRRTYNEPVLSMHLGRYTRDLAKKLLGKLWTSKLNALFWEHRKLRNSAPATSIALVRPCRRLHSHCEVES
jgi:hypothetical protein